VGETLLLCLRQNGTASEALAQVGKTRVDHNCPTNNQQIKQASAPESTIYNADRCPCTLVSIALRSTMDVGSFISSMHPFTGLSVVALCGILAYIFLIRISRQASIHGTNSAHDPNVPDSVNYFPSRKCNYTCGFCFHTETSSYVLPVAEAKRGLQLLKEAGMRKLNIAGGEPFLYPRLLTELLRYSKEELSLESVSIVSNGSTIREKWMQENCQWLDTLAVSCDSFNPETNKEIGRGDDGGNVIRLFQIADWFKKYGVKFKLNTVVNVHNWNENMAVQIEKLAPFRWKVVQCLIVAGENDSEDRKRDARIFLVTDEQWRTFCDRHQHLPC
jgi:sulfatase maturation enzyme AslB (radical SAM superfamily)